MSEKIEKQMVVKQATLRDQFAMAALTGLCASCSHLTNWEIAVQAYNIADQCMDVKRETKDWVNRKAHP